MRNGNPGLAEINLSVEHRAAVSRAFQGQRHSPLTEFKKGNIPPFAGRHLPEDVKKAISQSLKGRCTSPNTRFKAGQKMPWVSERNKRIPPPWTGQQLPEEARQKMIANLKGRHLHPETEFKKGQHTSPKTELTSERVKSWWKDPDFRARVIAGRLKNRKPTGPEKKLIEIIERHNLPFKYTGNGSFILEGLNPDFVNINGEKIAIDIFGDYWHTLKADKESYTEQGRKAIFTKYGWHLIVIWEREINSLTEEEIAETLR